MSDSYLQATAARTADALGRPQAAGPKVVLLVRHGQSMHNISDVAAYGDTGKDATLYDAPLSSLGESQAAALAGHAELAVAELAVVSPLTRAIQTMYGAFPQASARGTKGTAPPCTVWQVMAEHMTDSCDIGSGAASMAARWPALDFSSLPEVWWYIDDECSPTDALDSRRQFKECGFMEPEASVNRRVDEFVAALRARPECAARAANPCLAAADAPAPRPHTAMATPESAPTLFGSPWRGAFIAAPARARAGA